MRFPLLAFLFFASLKLAAQYPSQNMTLLANWDVDTLPVVGGAMFQYNDIWGYTDCDGNEYALLGSEGAVHFIQLLEDTVVERAFYQPGNIVLWRDMKTYRDRAFSMCDNCNEGLVMYDLSTLPDTATVLEQNTASFTAAHNLYVDEAGARLYVVGANDPNSDLIIYDLENLGDTLPDPLKLQLPGGYVHDINVTGDRAYASHGTNGLYIYDISEPDTFALLGIIEDYPQAGYNHSSWPSADGNYLVMADETFNTSLKLVDISDPADAQLTDLFRSQLLAPADTATIVHNPFIRDNYIIASYYHDGVQIFDWSDPTNVQRVAYFDTEPDNTTYGGFTGNWGVYPFFPSGRIIASDMHNGLFVLALDSIEFTPSTLLTEAPPLDTLGSPALCAGESVAFTGTLPDDAAFEWLMNNELSAADTLLVSMAATIFPTVTQRHCRYPVDSIAITQTLFPDTLLLSDSEVSICPGDTTTLVAVAGDYDYAWFLDGDVVISTQAQVETDLPGSYVLELFQAQCSAPLVTVTVDEFEVTPPTISVVGDSVLVADGGVSFQWFVDGAAIPGATEASYRFPVVTAPTAYFVRVVDANGCMAQSQPIELVVSTQFLSDTEFKVYPNPTREVLHLELPLAGDWMLSITNMLGEVQRVVSIRQRDEIDTAELAVGTYFLSGTHLASGARFRTFLSKH